MSATTTAYTPPKLFVAADNGSMAPFYVIILLTIILAIFTYVYTGMVMREWKADGAAWAMFAFSLILLIGAIGTMFLDKKVISGILATLATCLTLTALYKTNHDRGNSSQIIGNCDPGATSKYTAAVVLALFVWFGVILSEVFKRSPKTFALS